MRYLLQFQDAAGRVATELLYSRDDHGGLVGPDGAPLSTSEPFLMHGRSWRMVDVHVTEELVRILCAAALPSEHERAVARSSGSAVP
jgi:hypothetical protein